MNSGTVVTGTDGFTSITRGPRIMRATGAMSRTKLKLSLSLSVALIAAGGLTWGREAVGGGGEGGVGGNVAGGTGRVLDDEWLAEPLRQRLTYQTRDDLGYATGRKADDDAHRPRRIGLRPCNSRDGRERGSAGG